VIGTEASKIAVTVSAALPGIKSVMTDIAMAGDAVLSTTDELIGRAQSLTSSMTRYFADLDHGSIKVGICILSPARSPPVNGRCIRFF